ncbi:MULTISPECIES: nucleoside phosphorylase [Sphingomonadales]|uniref:Uridine phosphorylase n=1 Tax=Edaphosphingomonas haloaromaticamans TaxID=653954 RepID=A0A1S1H991_9SPHN|nr:nucleoside phosphorylase [Sphingomonas haloaromaticamans]OHT18677.1 Uridine phosphorylase [Sphingomonas haloaromaticamans]
MSVTDSPLHPGGLQMHLKIRPGDVPRYVLTPGDPGRVPVLGKAWDSYEDVAHFREYRTARGTIDGVEIGACSHGVGGPSTDIAIVELSNCGADTFIRVGSCAALQPEMEPGDLIISTGALRLTGTVDAYVDKSYPAIASYEVVMALIQAAEELGEKYHVGLSASVDSFYAGEVNQMPGGFRQARMDHVIDDLRQAKVANFEMEAATIFTLAQLFGFRGGMICSVGANRITEQRADTTPSIARCAKVAARAVAILAGWDSKKAEKGKAYLYPAIAA